MMLCCSAASDGEHNLDREAACVLQEVFLRSKASLGSMTSTRLCTSISRLSDCGVSIVCFAGTSISDMPPKSKKRASKADDYDSDGGFVEDAPQSKRAKTAISKDKQVDDDGNPYWEVRLSYCFKCCAR